MENNFNLRQPELIDSPALIIIPELVRYNIQKAVQMVGDVTRLRPHVKTHKSPEVTRLQIAAGITSFKCATVAEAEMLGHESVLDVLVAFPLHGPKVRRLIRLIRQFPDTRFSCLVDDETAAQKLEEAFRQADLGLDVFVDLNTGMNRTGIRPGPAVVGLYQKLVNSDVLRPRGLHAYDGHIRQSDPDARKTACDEAFAPVNNLAKELAARGWGPIEIVAGGSPSFPIHAARSGVECSPGTFVYWDYGYQTAFRDQGFKCAAWLMTRVISLPTDDLATLDLGHKSVAAENELERRVHFPGLQGWIPVIQSEEHLVLKKSAPTATNLKPGDVVYGIPWHICPTVALYERAYCVEEGELLTEWENWARQRKQSF